MKINVTQQLMQLDGTPMETGKEVCLACGQVLGESEPMTVRLAATRALTPIYRDEPSLPGDEKVKRFHLALRLVDSDEPELQAKDIILIKDMVGKFHGPVVVGRVWEIIDPKAADDDEA